MSQSRSEEPKPQSRPALSAFMSTFAAQPIRVMMSRAQEDFNPLTTFFKGWKEDGWKVLVKGLPINLFRGTISTAASAYAKRYAGYYVDGAHPLVATSAQLGAAAVADMSVAYALETWFIRRSNLDKFNMKNGIKFSRFNFAPSLLPLYFIRGMGFGSIVFFSNHLPPLQKNSILISGTVFTATAQKFISAVATGDIMARDGTVPDFKEGVMKTLRNVTRGDVYTHPSYRGYFKNPASLTKQLANFLYVGCNPSMFCWRLAYLYSVGYVFAEAEKNGSKILARLGMFAKAVNSDKSYLLTDSERDIMKESDDHNPFYKHV